MPEGKLLLHALRNYPQRKCNLIERYIRPNESTAFGKSHEFSKITNYEDFTNAVPLHNYTDLEPWIKRAIHGETAVLTAEAPIGFEITSGTSTNAKIIPITPAFQQELATALSLWMRHWENNYPEVFNGSTYWSLSPRLGKKRHTPSGLPLGFSDDGAYFPKDIQEALAHWLILPDASDEDIFKNTAKKLLGTPDLKAVSVWSPTFFLKLDEALGTSATWSEIWPELRIVSCWADAQASMWIDQVRTRLGSKIYLEPKGLLATEGITSIPGNGGAMIASGIHFHEFIDCENGRVVQNIEPERRFEVVLTTGAGLYRYKTGDLIEIDKNSRVHFLGRSGDGCDLVGEKLDTRQVIAAFRQANASGFIRVSAAFLHYEIWTTSRGETVLAHLKHNPHFSQALETGQLSSCEIKFLPNNWQTIATHFLASKRGSREGDIKLPVIEKHELSELWES